MVTELHKKQKEYIYEWERVGGGKLIHSLGVNVWWRLGTPDTIKRTRSMHHFHKRSPLLILRTASSQVLGSSQPAGFALAKGYTNTKIA